MVADALYSEVINSTLGQISFSALTLLGTGLAKLRRAVLAIKRNRGYISSSSAPHHGGDAGWRSNSAKVLISPLFMRETPVSSPGPTFLLIGSGDSCAARAAAGSRRRIPELIRRPSNFAGHVGGLGCLLWQLAK